MKIVDAYWEKRNLGINCIEITVEQTDEVEELKQALQQTNAAYIVVKVPELRMDMFQELTARGYCFVETLIGLEKKIELPRLCHEQKCKLPYLSYQIDAAGSRDRVAEQIDLGLFNTDRISIDSHFSKADAMNRYNGMLTDELVRGGELMEYLWEEEPIGFTCFRNISQDEYYQSLSGIYEKYRGHGFGFLPSYFPIIEMEKRSAKRVVTSISTNNVPSLRVHIRDGYVPKTIKNIFVKHNNIV